MLIGIEIKTNTERDASDSYYKHKVVLIKHASSTFNGALRSGAQPIATSTFGESGQDLIAVTDEGKELIGYFRFSDLTFASQKQLSVGYKFNIFYVPSKYYGKSSEADGVLGVIDNIVMCCERFKAEGF